MSTAKYILKTFRHGYSTSCGGRRNLDSALFKRTHPKEVVEKRNKRHGNERSDVAISLPLNIRDCHDVARKNEKRTFSASFSRWATRAALFVFLLGTCSCDKKQETAENERPAVAVKVMVVSLSDEAIVKTYTGTLEGERQAVIYAKIAEAVETVHVSEGERVKADQVLITLDKSGPSSRYQEALSLYRNAEKTYRKMDYLFGEGAVSESQFDAAKTEYEVTKAAFEAAARLVEVQSPINGVVTSLKVSKGDFLGPGQQLATVATVDRLRVKFGVNAADVGSLTPGSAVTVSLGDATYTVEGIIHSVARSADPVTRAFQVEVVFDNSERAFRPGLLARIDVPLEELTGVATVPRQAVIIRREEQTVFVVSNGIAQKRAVTIGADLGRRIVVASGLSPGDTVVTLGQDYLQDGIEVNITGIIESGQ